jgi:hypothetical protein
VSVRIPHLGAVIIGQNESKSLAQALDSVMSVAAVCVYVDSASQDNSVAIAESRGAVVLRLADDGRLSPARARNQGLFFLQKEYPTSHYIFFLDGDCIASPQWLSGACLELDRQPTLGVLCGRLQEGAPHRSVYNRLFEFEWQDVPAGRVLSCGGIFLARANAISECGGFEPNLRSGEEIHMCWRMSRRGWQVIRVPDVMATHDADMHSLVEWLARSRRDGYGAMQILLADFRGVGRYQLRPSASAWMWTLGWVATLAAGLGALVARRRLRTAASFALPIVLSLPVVKAMQIAHRVGQQSHFSNRDATIYGLLMMVSKWSYVHGQVLCLLESLRTGRRSRKEASSRFLRFAGGVGHSVERVGRHLAS